MKEVIKKVPENALIGCLPSIAINQNDQLNSILKALKLHFKSAYSFIAFYNLDELCIKSSSFPCNQNTTVPIDLQTINSEKAYSILELNETLSTELKKLWNLELKPCFYLNYPLINKDGLVIGSVGCLDVEKKIIDEEKLNHIEILINILITYLDEYCIAREKGFEFLKLSEKLVHDLRNPLTIISLHAELIKSEDNVSEDNIDACNTIRDSVEKMSVITNQFIAKQKSSC